MDMNMVANIICMAGVSACCAVQGIADIKRIYPTRYGKNHVELKGTVVGKQDMKVNSRGGIHIVQVPVIQFIYKGKNYELADETNYIFKNYKIGDEVIVCFHPEKNENAVIIKRGGFVIETFGIWFVLAIGCFVVMILSILVLLKVIG